MKNEKTATKSEISFAKQVFSNKLFLTGVGGLLVFVLLSFIYLYNPRYVPTLFKSTADIVGDTIVGKDLAETIDATRDESGATSIRTIFNTNKEQNLEKHCEKKEENGQVQEKCYKTYENEEFGYSVLYPEGWVISENNNVTSIRPSESSEDGIGIYFYKNVTQSITGWWAEESNNYAAKFELKGNLKIRDYEVLRYKELGGLGEEHILIKKDDKIIDLLNMFVRDDELAPILSSIRFK